MVVLNVVMITFGQVIAYGIDAGFANVSGGWRWMVGLGTVPAGIQLMCLAFLPESREFLALWLSRSFGDGRLPMLSVVQQGFLSGGAI